MSAVDSTPIPTATLTEVDASDPPRTLTELPAAEADAAGRIVYASLADEGKTFVVRSPGYVPAALTGGASPQSPVALDPAARLRVSVIDSYGKPVDECSVMLSIQSIGVPSTLPEQGIGHPLARNPLWLGVSGAMGSVEFDELPEGTFLLSVFHEFLIPSTQVGALSKLVVRGDISMTVMMQEMFGVVFECPSQAEVEYASWNVATLGLDRSTRVLSRLGAVRDTLQRRFPSSHVYVHKPLRSDSDFLVEYRIAARDGTFWRGKWPMRPVSTILDPIFMEQVNVERFARVRVRLLDESGTEFDGIPLVLADREAGYRIDTVSGRETVLPHGRYVLQPSQINKWIFHAFGGLRGLEMVVSDATSPVYDVTLDGDFVTVEVHPSFDTEELLSPLHISVDAETRKGRIIANWTPSRGPIREVVPTGVVYLTISSPAYERVEERYEVPADRDRFAIDVKLKERRGESR